MNLYELKELARKSDDAKAELNAALERYTLEHCPHKVGGEVEITGYSHTGKTMRVEYIAFRRGWRDSFEYVISGRVIKKNGDVGSQRCKFTEKVEQ